MGNLFQQVKDTVKAQKSNFCSRSTRVTLLNQGRVNPDEIRYTTCDGGRGNASTQELDNNYGYIPDCVQGGSPIISSNGYKYLVQYGTTNCESDKICVRVTPCEGGESPIVDISVVSLSQRIELNTVYKMVIEGVGTICFTTGNSYIFAPSGRYPIVNSVTPYDSCITCLG